MKLSKNPKKIKIILIGEINFSEKILKFLIKKKMNIVGVITRKKKKNKDFKDLAIIAKKNKISFFYKKKK